MTSAFVPFNNSDNMTKVIPSKKIIYPESMLCPYCKVHAQLMWGFMSMNSTIYGKYAVCTSCSKPTYWNVEGDIVYPNNLRRHNPHPDMPDDIKKDFIEAADIEQLSVRGAAALLRLAIQKLCKELGEAGKSINEDIKNLVKKGLSPEMQKAMDAVRVIGNEQVHPGQLDLRDSPEVTKALFEITNLIVDQTISRSKKIDLLYKMLPEEKRREIDKRDKIESYHNQNRYCEIFRYTLEA